MTSRDTKLRLAAEAGDPAALAKWEARKEAKRAGSAKYRQRVIAGAAAGDPEMVARDEARKASRRAYVKKKEAVYREAMAKKRAEFLAAVPGIVSKGG